MSRLYANHDQLGLLTGWAAAVGYSLQLYFDFSGYSDMAVGLAWLLGFRFPQNFNSPFKAENISDFWRRWHMSLSSWFRDYLFIPLGGSRLRRARDGAQPRDHDVPRRPLARRRLDVRRLGARARRSSSPATPCSARPG